MAFGDGEMRGSQGAIKGVAYRERLSPTPPSPSVKPGLLAREF